MDKLNTGVDVTLGDTVITIKPGMQFQASAADMREIISQVNAKELTRYNSYPDGMTNEDMYWVKVLDEAAPKGILGLIAAQFGVEYLSKHVRRATVVTEQWAGSTRPTGQSFDR